MSQPGDQIDVLGFRYWFLQVEEVWEYGQATPGLVEVWLPVTGVPNLVGNLYRVHGQDLWSHLGIMQIEPSESRLLRSVSTPEEAFRVGLQDRLACCRLSIMNRKLQVIQALRNLQQDTLDLPLLEQFSREVQGG